MSAEDTWTYRSVGQVEGDTRLVRMDIATGRSVPAADAPGVKLFPSVLPSGEVAYLRRDAKNPGIFYGAGTPGPKGADLRSPSWSPDGKQVVYSRFVNDRKPEPAPLWSRNPNYELFTTSWLPAYDVTGEHLAVTMRNGGTGKTALYIVDEGKPARTILEKEGLILAPQWSPDGHRLVFGVGQFSAFLDFAVGARKPVDPVNGGAQVGVATPSSPSASSPPDPTTTPSPHSPPTANASSTAPSGPMAKGCAS